jgi:hypothetical protein
MDPSDAELDHENQTIVVIGAAERQVTEDRFGGAWIDGTHRPALIGIAVVDPTQSDVDAISGVAREAGWTVEVVGVRYSQKTLLGWLHVLNAMGLPGDAWISLGWDPRYNAIQAELRRVDAQVEAWLQGQVPEDALMVVIRPGSHWVASAS